MKMCHKVWAHKDGFGRSSILQTYCLTFKPGAGLRPMRTWFLKIVSEQTSVCVFMCVCPPQRLLITSGVMWCHMDPIRLVNKFYSCNMATVVVIVNGHGP